LGTESSSEATDREQVWLIQTPQTFPANVLLEAFTQDEHVYFTDEASVVEKLGYNIHIIESSPINIKITYPEDLVIAHAYTKN
jgi:2-C-methyl-D-erythritol 4-phosphate cytidylyltransferase